MTRSSDILFMAEYIKNVLYFATTRQGKVLKSTVDTHYFSIDDVLTYDNYYSDFGPLNLGCVYKYCKLLNEKLKLYFNKQVIVHYTSTEPNKKANAAFVLGCYGVLYMNLSPGDALKPLLAHGQSYRDQKDTNSIHHRGTAAGGGDPRLISGSRGSISRNSQHSAKSNDSRTRYTSGYQTQIPTFRTSQGPVIKTINDAKNILLQNTIRREDRGTLLNSNMKVTPHYSRVSQYASGSGRLVINNSGHLTPTYNSASRNAVQNSAPRRRLGRSPSPPQPRIVEQSRATNTPLTYSGKFLAEDASKTVLKAELSRLKVVAARNGSIGTASVGAASLGARRDAPTPKRAPSVHSDERSLATQGDLLNSIKFQRRYLNSFISEKLSGLVQDKISTTSKERISIKDGNSGIRGNHQYYDASATPKDRISTKDGNTGNRGHNQYYDVSANSKDRISIKDGSTGTVNRGSNQCYDVSDARERTRTTTTSRSGFGPQRPSSPKARRNSQMYY